MLGSGGALIIDRRSDRVFSRDEMSRNLPGPLLGRLPCKNIKQLIEAWRVPIQLLADGPLAGEGSLALIPVGSIESPDLDAFTASLREALGDKRELLISRDLLTTRACSTQLLLLTPGAAKREQLRQLREQLTLQGTPVAGWVLLDTTLEG